MIYEQELIQKRLKEIEAEINNVKESVLEPETLYIALKQQGLFNSIKLASVFRKQLAEINLFHKAFSIIQILNCIPTEKLNTRKYKNLFRKLEKLKDKIIAIHPLKQTNITPFESSEQYIEETNNIADDITCSRNKLVTINKVFRSYFNNILLIVLMPFLVVIYGISIYFSFNVVAQVFSHIFGLGCWLTYFVLRLREINKVANCYRLDIKAKSIKLLYHIAWMLLYLLGDFVFCSIRYDLDYLLPTITVLSIFALITGVFIYDIFCSSKFFIGELSYSALTVAIGISLSSALVTIDNVWVSQIVTTLLVTVEVGLILMILKAFLIEQRKIETILEIICLIIVLFMTIAIGSVLIYRFTWNHSPDNSLFIAIMSIYAALIGGVLTLTGVAWTIKHSENQRKDEERRKAQPLFSFVCKTLDRTKTTLIFCHKLKDMENLICDPTDSQDCLLITNFAIENTSKIEFFICGLLINGVLYRTLMKELVKKEDAVYFVFNNSFLALKTIDEIKLYIEDVIGNFYTMQLDFSINESAVTINGNKPIQFTGETNE